MDKKFIILADDDVAFANLYKMSLVEQNWDVEIVKNGQEALDLMKKRKPDLLLLDLDMPIKSGFNVLEEMKDDPMLSQIITIVMTNSGDDVAVLRAIEFGAKNYVVKVDTSIDKMIEIIKKYFI